MKREDDPMKKSILELTQVAHRQAETESSQDLEAILATMEGEPTYEYHPAGKSFTGMDNTRRLYTHFIADVQPRMVNYKLVSESVGDQGVAQEFDLLITLLGDETPTWNRIMSIMVFGDAAIVGERMYGSDKLLRTLTGPLWDDMSQITSLGRD